jgi:glutamyl-tRNA reductase
MTLIALGLNHQTAPVALRERVAFGDDAVVPALRGLAAEAGIREALILSTCNRTEIYCHVEAGAENAPTRWLHQHHGLTAGNLDEFLYRHDDQAAVRHLFRVATGLDSLVLGEPQILGQVKQAYHRAREAGVLSAALERLLQNAFAVAKRVRTDTRIGANPVSVAFAAVRLAQQVFADLSRSTVLLIGAGDTIELAARHVSNSSVGRLLVANRTLANAQALTARVGGEAVALSELERHLRHADVVISSTASREPVLTRALVADAIRQRRHRPMLVIDLAVPRDVEAEVAELDDVFVYTVDDMAQVVEDSMRSRREAAREADAIIDLASDHFMAWCRGLDGHGAIRHLREQAERERDAVLARARALIEAGKPPAEALEYLANTLTNKLLHAPASQLRAAALRGDHDLLRAGERLFATDTPDSRPQ